MVRWYITLKIVLPQLREILTTNNEISILGALGAFDKICEDGALTLESQDPNFFKDLITWCIQNMCHQSPKIRYVFN
jgi:ABC-type sugar transport system permease subunit